MHSEDSWNLMGTQGNDTAEADNLQSKKLFQIGIMEVLIAVSLLPSAENWRKALA